MEEDNRAKKDATTEEELQQEDSAAQRETLEKQDSAAQGEEVEQEEQKSAAKRQLAQELQLRCDESGRNLGDVAYSLNISRSVADDIESGNLFDKTKRVFAQGYILSFVKELGMERARIEQLLNIIYNDKSSAQSLRRQVTFTSDYEEGTALHQQRQRIIKTVIPITLCLFAFGAIVYWKLYIDAPATQEVISRVSEPAPEEGVKQPTFTPYIEKTPENPQEEEGVIINPIEDGLSASEKKENNLLEFSFTEESWLEVLDSQGRELAWQLFAPGEKISFHGEPPYEILIGNGRGTSVKYEGKEIPLSINPSDNTARLILPKVE